LSEEENSKAIFFFMNSEVEHPVNALRAENDKKIITVIKYLNWCSRLLLFQSP